MAVAGYPVSLGMSGSRAERARDDRDAGPDDQEQGGRHEQEPLRTVPALRGEPVRRAVVLDDHAVRVAGGARARTCITEPPGS